MIPVLALTAMLLTACEEFGSPPATTQLPPIPEDIRTCFVGVVDIPDRALTVGDVERLWKTDRVRSIIMRRCGLRVLTFYDELRANWR